MTKRHVDGFGDVHWHGPVDDKVHWLARDFVEEFGGCASCLATEIQRTIEEYLSEIEDKSQSVMKKC